MMPRRVALGWILVTALLASGSVAGEVGEFEALTAQAAASVLQPDQLASADFHVDDPLLSDGVMYRFVVDSRFGSFAAYGRDGLALRLHELAALAQLSRTSELGVVVSAVGDSVTGSARTVVAVATHPIETVTGIPRGISRLFHGYAAQARELGDAAAAHPGERQPSTARSREADAKRYVARYFGLSASERAWYRKLSIDPYTDNEPLIRAVHRIAHIESATKFGLRFAPLPGLPYAGQLGRAMEAIYNEDPAVLRERRRARLAGYGLTADEVRRFENSLLLTPTRQQLLDTAATALTGVAGRAELFRHALGIDSQVEADVYVRSVLRLVVLHAERPLTAILPALRMPAGRTADGTIVVVAAFDALRWTAEVAAAEADARAALPAERAGVELWLAALPSPRAAAELEARGWQVRCDPGVAPAHGEP